MAADMKHTPGPWRVVRSEKAKHRSARFIMGGRIFVGKAYGHDGEPVDDNARLIADAPRMREALQRIQDYEVPIGVGAEVADWLKTIASEALTQ